MSSPVIPVSAAEDNRNYKLQCQRLVALLIALLYERGSETPERKFLLQLAQERHTTLGHKSDFHLCTDETCSAISNALVMGTQMEALFTVPDLEELKKYDFHYSSPMAGVIRVWIEEGKKVELAI